MNELPTDATFTIQVKWYYVRKLAQLLHKIKVQVDQKLKKKL